MSLRKLMRQKVTYRPVTDGTRGATYGDPITVPARVQFGQKLVVTKTEDQALASATVYMLPREDAPNLGDELELPDGSARQVISVSQHVDGRRPLLLSISVA